MVLNRSDYLANGEPATIVANDFDLDSDLDLVVANTNSSEVSLLLNNGDGSFAEPVSFASGAGYSVTDGDFDRDGDIDLVTANHNSLEDSVSLLLNNGDGTFAAPVDFTTGDRPYINDPADLDGDGDLDLITHNTVNQNSDTGIVEGDTISLLYNDGKGKFAAPKNLTVGEGVQGVATGDLDSDGDLDLVTANEGEDTVSILLNNGQGEFAAPTKLEAGIRSASPIVADFDGDGDSDVATANFEGNSVSVFKNNGDATFTEQTVFPTEINPYDLTPADMDGDGDVDLIMRHSIFYTSGTTSGSTISILTNNGSGEFDESEVFTVGNTPAGVVVADLDGRGNPDIATPNFQDDNVTVYLDTELNSSGNEGTDEPDNLLGSDGKDTIEGLAGNDVITGGDDDDLLRGGAGNDSLQGNAGNDSLEGNLGIDTLLGGDGNDTLVSGNTDDVLDGNAGRDLLIASGGNNSLTGGTQLDRFEISVQLTEAVTAITDSITDLETGEAIVIKVDAPVDSSPVYNSETGIVTLNNREVLQLEAGLDITADNIDERIQVVVNEDDSLTVDLEEFLDDPGAYMNLIQDFDGNTFGSAEAWENLGTADIQGDGDEEYIFVNPELSRWATVGVNQDGLIDFGDNGQGGDTRVVGIYIDPLIATGEVTQGSEFDSQQRFQGDLNNNNLELLATDDYNGDGLQEAYFRLGDGSALLHAYMEADGNIQYANYQSESDLEQFMTANDVDRSVWENWL
jgi:hypothetical protein